MNSEMDIRETMIEGGAVTSFATLGLAMAHLLDIQPTLGVILAGVFGLVTVAFRCLFEYWRITREDREKLRAYRRQLREAGIKPDDEE